MSPNELFYSKLPVSNTPLTELLVSEKLFQKAPESWHVILTDIKKSTSAVLEGQNQQVNLVATGSIVCVLNIAFRRSVTIPFFFGGDGATFIVPPTIVEDALQALLIYQRDTMANFNLDIRVGTVPVSNVYEDGHSLRLAKFKISGLFSIPVMLGNGLNYAERLIKNAHYKFEHDESSQIVPDLSGMQCRWDKIDHPDNTDEVVTLLVTSVDEVRQPAAYSKVINYIDEIYGSAQKRQPISIPKLKLSTTFNRLGIEMRATLNKIRVFELFRNWLIMIYSYLYLRTRNGRTYLNNLVEMSDTLVIDGKVNTVISGTAAQRAKLEAVLNDLERSGDIVYGLHVSTGSIMSCYVRDLNEDHIHFVDGSEGGYTRAASVLKKKLA